jgi:hypothetical protein
MAPYADPYADPAPYGDPVLKSVWLGKDGPVWNAAPCGTRAERVACI